MTMQDEAPLPAETPAEEVLERDLSRGSAGVPVEPGPEAIRRLEAAVAAQEEVAQSLWATYQRSGTRGGPHGERNSYFCCELLMEACVAAGLVDPVTTRPAATYPRDVFFDRSCNPHLNRHLNLSCDWHPPARWVSSVPNGDDALSTCR